jgi:hypothetical protein
LSLEKVLRERAKKEKNIGGAIDELKVVIGLCQTKMRVRGWQSRNVTGTF